jgi:hypothetical protein
VRPGRCPVRGVRSRGRLGFGAEKGRYRSLNANCFNNGEFMES